MTSTYDTSAQEKVDELYARIRANLSHAGTDIQITGRPTPFRDTWILDGVTAHITTRGWVKPVRVDVRLEEDSKTLKYHSDDSRLVAHQGPSATRTDPDVAKGHALAQNALKRVQDKASDAPSVTPEDAPQSTEVPVSKPYVPSVWDRVFNNAPLFAVLTAFLVVTVIVHPLLAVMCMLGYLLAGFSADLTDRTDRNRFGTTIPAWRGVMRESNPRFKVGLRDANPAPAVIRVGTAIAAAANTAAQERRELFYDAFETVSERSAFLEHVSDLCERHGLKFDTTVIVEIWDGKTDGKTLKGQKNPVFAFRTANPNAPRPGLTNAVTLYDGAALFRHPSVSSRTHSYHCDAQMV